MQASLEAEARGKAEAMRMKKKLEQDMNELESALDSANRGRADADKTIKKLQQQMREQQQQVATVTPADDRLHRHVRSESRASKGTPPASRKSPGNTFESGGTCPVRSAGKKIFLVVPFHCFDSKSTISRFGERLRDGQYSLVSFLFAVLSLTMPSCPAICKVGARAPRALWSRRHWGQKQESWGGQNLFDVYV